MPPEVERPRADAERRFGRFVILAQIGRGGMGAVYRAWDERLKRVVALKTLLDVEGGGTEKDTLQRFVREAEAVARLRHPNIVSVHDAGEHEGRPWIAMDLIEGHTLAARIAAEQPQGAEAGTAPTRLPLVRALEALRDVARAVHHAHEQGVVHRDLKPQNIIIDTQGRPFVLDFGLASIQGTWTKITKTGAALGTPAYMAPEQAGGTDLGEVGPRSDVYALGATLYHVLTGRPPFEGATDVNVLAAVLTKDPVAPGRLNARARGDLETICLKCIEKEPDQRYACAAALADDLDRHLAGDPIAARPLGPMTRLLRRARRNKATSALLALAVALVGGLVVNNLLARVERQRVARAARAGIVEKARSDARTAGELFATARRSAAPRDAGFEAERLRTDRLLALGHDALHAWFRCSLLDTGDREASREAFNAAMDLGEVALAAEQWSVAAGAFEKAAALGVDDARARERVLHVATARTLVLKRHRQDVVAAIASVSSQNYDDALFTLVRYSEAQTAEILCKELDAASALLVQATREALLAVAAPSDAEAGKGALRIDGLSAALDTWFAKSPAERLDLAYPAAIEGAANRLAERSAPSSRVPLTARSALALAQRTRLGEDHIRRIKLACDALGRIGIREPARDALALYLSSEEDDGRAAPAAIALCLLGGEECERLVLAARRRIGVNSAFSERVHPYLGRTGVVAKLAAATPAAYVERASKRLAKGDVEGAISDLSWALERDQHMAAAWAGRASARSENKDPAGAIEDASKAIELEPRLASAWGMRGYARLRTGDLDGALADLSRAIELDASLVQAWNNRGNARKQKGDMDGALADYSRALELQPAYALAWSNRGIVWKEKGNLKNAMDDLSRAIELNPRLALALASRGLLRAGARDLDGAIEDATRAIEIDPGDARAWEVRGGARCNKGDFDGAIEDYSQAIGLDAHSAGAWAGRGVARRKKGDLEGAMTDYARSLDLDPRSATTWLNRGMLKKRLSDFGGAIEDYSRSIELDPSFASAFFERGVARQARGDSDGAISDFTRVVELDPRHALAWSNRGFARKKRGDLAGAAADLERFLALAPNHADAPAVRRQVEALRRREQ